MSNLKSLFAAILLSGIGVSGAEAQIFESIAASGGDASGAGGSSSYSVGQLVYSPISGAGGTMEQGIQIVNPGAPLPIRLQSFSGECQGGEVRLMWVTAFELNNVAFNIEKSDDGSTWAIIATIKGANTSNTSNSYTYTDEKPNTVASYYRLQQVDLSGHFTYSDVIYILNCGNKQSSIVLYPNPVADGVYLNTENFEGMSYELYDVTGKLIRKGNIQSRSTYIGLLKLATSTYILKVKQNETELKTFKIFKN